MTETRDETNYTKTAQGVEHVSNVTPAPDTAMYDDGDLYGVSDNEALAKETNEGGNDNNDPDFVDKGLGD